MRGIPGQEYIRMTKQLEYTWFPGTSSNSDRNAHQTN